MAQSFLAVLLAVLMVAAALHRGGDFLRSAEFALLLLVAAIPVAMPAVGLVASDSGGIFQSLDAAVATLDAGPRAAVAPPAAEISAPPL